MAFLPTTNSEMKQRGWDEVDFVLVTGDAYVDHPSFGTAIISRILERYGYKVGILDQPRWDNCDDFKEFGKPRLGFLINSGVVDSMVNNFSVFKHRRRKDIYSPGGEVGHRPDRAVIVYSNRAKEAYKDAPIIIGGLEASLRRLGHYDYWDDKVRRSILLDSRADILVYGMGEKSILEIAEALESGIEVKDITWIAGTCVVKKEIDNSFLLLPAFEEIKEDKLTYAKSFQIQYDNNDALNAEPLAERYDENVYVVQNIPQLPLEREELDDLFDLDYERTYHPKYEKLGGVPSIREVKFSIIQSRGCFGGCAFCAITYHQGRQVRSRSKESILREANKLTEFDDFKGYIHDIGGPTANFRSPACDNQLEYGVCKRKDCLTPHICNQMKVDHSEYLDILRAVRNIDGIKKVFIRSGIRFDYLMADDNDEFMDELVQHHISGTLKVAPEHVAKNTLKYMRKPEMEVYEEFTKKFEATNKKYGKKQYLIPYLISSHPGTTLEDAIELAIYLKKHKFVPDQVQDFYPTPGTLSTTMYYTGVEPFTMEEVYVPKEMEDKKMQRALLHFNKPQNRALVLKALKKAHREDAIEILYGGYHHKY